MGFIKTVLCSSQRIIDPSDATEVENLSELVLTVLASGISIAVFFPHCFQGHSGKIHIKKKSSEYRYGDH